MLVFQDTLQNLKPYLNHTKNNMAEDKLTKIEKEYTIPLREKVRSVPRYKKTNKAVRTIKEFLARHMKVYDRDLNKIKIDKYLNEYLWFRGIRNPPHKVKIKATREGEIVRVELLEFPEKLKFKKAREEKREQKGAETAKKKKEEKKTEEKIEEKNKDGVEDKKEESEKKSAVIEAGQEFEKAEAKKMKHTTKPKTSSQDRQEKNIYKKTHA